MRMIMLLVSCTVLMFAATASRNASQDVAEVWNDRLSALRPEDPMGYFELAEEVLDRAPNESADRALAAWLFGTAGRLDRENLGASCALALATTTRDRDQARRLKAVAMMLDVDGAGSASAGGNSLDAETAFEVSESFGRFRTGRTSSLRKVLREESIRASLRRFEDVLPDGGIDWLDSASLRSRGRPDLDDEERRLMLRVEVQLLEGESPSWATEVLGVGGEPLLEVASDEIDLLLGGDPDRPYWRNGKWQAKR